MKFQERSWTEDPIKQIASEIISLNGYGQNEEWAGRGMERKKRPKAEGKKWGGE